MKSVSLILNILLLVALAVLYFLFFSNQKKEDEKHEEVTTTAQKSKLNIAYIKTDSLILNYDLSQDLHDDFTKKQEAYNKEFASKQKSLQKQAASFQEKLQRGGFLTEQRAIKERDKLLGKEQEIQKLDAELTNKLAELQASNNQQIQDSLINYLKAYNQKNKFDYIINGAAVLIGDEASNITREVLDDLNKKYAGDQEEE